MYAVEFYGPTPGTLGGMSWQRTRPRFATRHAADAEAGLLRALGYRARVVRV